MKLDNKSKKEFEGPHISRKEAIKKGLKKYFEGKTCSRGHVDFRWVSGGCNSCLNEKRKERYRRKNIGTIQQGPKILSYGPYLTSSEAREKRLNFYYVGHCFRCGSGIGYQVKKGCNSCRDETNKEWKNKNPESLKRYQKKYHQTAKSKETRKKWNKDNEDKLREQWRIKEARYREDKSNTRAIANQIRRSLNDALKGQKKSKSTLLIVGVKNWNELKQFIESQFTKGMKWELWKKDGWHLDHVRPVASFDFKDKEQQQVCFNWRNLRPLWSEDNQDKRDKYEPLDELAWVERMQSLGYEGELFLKYEEGNSY